MGQQQTSGPQLAWRLKWPLAIICSSLILEKTIRGTKIIWPTSLNLLESFLVISPFRANIPGSFLTNEVRWLFLCTNKLLDLFVFLTFFQVSCDTLQNSNPGASLTCLPKSTSGIGKSLNNSQNFCYLCSLTTQTSELLPKSA